MRKLFFLASILVLLGLTALAASSRADARDYVVIVNPDNRTGAVDRGFLEDAFLKKITHWPNDEVLYPVDLPSSSSVRRRFSEDILNRSVEAVKGYWQQRIFSGRDVPPPELDSDEEVVKYVMKHAGGVGYVSPESKLGGARVLVVR